MTTDSLADLLFAPLAFVVWAIILPALIVADLVNTARSARIEEHPMHQHRDPPPRTPHPGRVWLLLFICLTVAIVAGVYVAAPGGG